MSCPLPRYEVVVTFENEVDAKVLSMLLTDLAPNISEYFSTLKTEIRQRCPSPSSPSSSASTDGISTCL